MATHRWRATRRWLGSIVLLGCLGFVAEVPAQNNNNQQRQSVGGVAIDVAGVLRATALDDLNTLRELRLRLLQEQPGDLKQPTELRKVSLRKLDEAITAYRQEGKTLADEMRWLAGLQNIRYVFVYPEQQDIVLAGFAEGWKVDERGNLVGLTTGRPVMMLDDLLVALRVAFSNNSGLMSCSIDPSQAGMEKVSRFVSTLKSIGDPQATTQQIEQQLGLQNVTISGVPATSHFAQVLVSADFRMKQLGMGLTRSPVAGLPSYIQMLNTGAASGLQNMTPRWWMVPSFDPLLTDAEGLSWELRGSSVKTMTEDSYIAANGQKTTAGRTSPTALKWAELMTAKYRELAVREPIFGELQNCMELAVAAALIAREDLPRKAGFSFNTLLDPVKLPALEMAVPKHTESHASALKKGNTWVISASGGVEIEPGKFVQKAEKSESLGSVRKGAAPAAKSWWWN